MVYGKRRRGSPALRLRAVVAAALAIAVLASSGCGSESDAAAPEPTIDLSKLETGSYNTKPQEPAVTDPVATGRNIEALRLTEVMPLPKDIDPALTYGSGYGRPFTAADSPINGVDLSWLRFTNFAADATGLVSGFHTAAQSNVEESLSFTLAEAVMIFDSDSSAAASAIALARSGFNGLDFDQKNNKYEPEPAVSPKYPSAHVIWKPHTQVLASWYATGRFVINTLVRNPENFELEVSDQAGLMALSDKAISVTADRLKTFVPTPPDKLVDLARDPEKMSRITLPLPREDNSDGTFEGVLSTAGDLHRRQDQTKARALFEKTGTDFISYGAGTLVRTRDAAAAKTYIKEVSTDKFRTRIESPPGLPTASCFEYHGPSGFELPFDCYVSNGRYAAHVEARQQRDAYQMISAQYAVLANDK